MGVFAYQLRFPGQYFDAEMALSYNYFRDYDPSTGRYLQSDPIGLDGGLNIYAYAALSPLQFIDRFGLDADQCRKRCMQTYERDLAQLTKEYVDEIQACRTELGKGKGGSKTPSDLGGCMLGVTAIHETQIVFVERIRDKCLAACGS